MLGKTNITTLSEGAVATEIEDYNWIQMQAGVNGNFVKAVYKNGYLAAITADGTVAYTKDGEVWQTSRLEYKECKLNDIAWDGSRFILVGKCTEGSGQRVLVVASVDLVEYTRMAWDNTAYNREILAIFPQNSIYTMITKYDSNLFIVNICLNENTVEEKNTVKLAMNATNASTVYYSIAQNASGILIYYADIDAYQCLHTISRITNEGNESQVKRSSDDSEDKRKRKISVFECKGTLYAMELCKSTGYDLNKITDSNEIMSVCTGQNFMLVDGVYFNECQVFINSHDMLVVKKGENIADKTMNDMVEIAPELIMNCITKAFGQLYIFGNQGVILRSSVETNNDNAIAVQTLSAKKALAEARIYTDEKYAALEARIIALETANSTK